MKKENIENTDGIFNGTEFSLIKLYNTFFPYAVVVLFILFSYSVLLYNFTENNVLIINIFSAFLFFRIFRNNKKVIKNQIYFHQVFIFIAVIITAVWFITTGGYKEFIYLLFIGSISSFFLLHKNITIVYVFALVVFNFTLSHYFSFIKWDYIVYSFAFSALAIVVSYYFYELINGNKAKNDLVVIPENQTKEKDKYRLLFDNGGCATLLLSEKFSIINCNKRGETIFKNKQLEGTSFLDLIVDSDKRKEVLENKIKNLNKGELLEDKCEFLKEKKAPFFAEISLLKIKINEEIVVQVLIRDYSEKQENETKLTEDVESFQSIINYSPSGIFIFTNDNLVYKNAKGKELFDLYFNKNQKHLLEEVLKEKDANSYREIILGNDNTFSFSLVPFIYKGKESKLVMLIDVTLQNEYNNQKIRAEFAEKANKNLSLEIKNHKETQKYLIENTSKLNALFESSNSLYIFTIDRDLRISSFNSSFKRRMVELFKINVKEGDDFLKTFPIKDDAYKKLIKKFKRALRGESVHLKSRLQIASGKEVWIESFVSPVKVEGEPIKEIAFIAHEITEKVENEIRILDSEANNRATISAIPDMLFKINSNGYFTYFRPNDDGIEIIEKFTNNTSLVGEHILDIFKEQKQARVFLSNVQKALRTGKVHTQNFIIPFIIGKTTKKRVFENRYSKVNNREVFIITRDVTDNVEFERQLIESVKEKEVLLKEVHHRVKNNLQVISSILNLQSSYVEDEKTLEIINESQNRIRSMSYIHESLYQTKDFSSIDFHDYITNLIQNLVHSYQLYSGKTKLNLDIDKIKLVLDQAIPCGLILNELVSNSLKYAYPEDIGGEIHIEIKEIEGKIKIRIEDFGVGLPKDFKIEESDTLGLGLVDSLVDQIDGELILKTENGTKYLIIFEKQDL